MNYQAFQDNNNTKSLDPINELNSMYEQENSANNNSVNQHFKEHKKGYGLPPTIRNAVMTP
jgi:hypothetical protein